MSRKITFLTLFLWLMTVTFPVIAQQKADTTYTFRFVPQKDMFYVPWNGNDTELARLLECIENNKATILDGKMPLLVDGYMILPYFRPMECVFQARKSRQCEPDSSLG